jgi:hypothetical protein
MAHQLRALLLKADSCPVSKLLWLNFALGIFVFSANAMALWLIRTHPSPDAANVEHIARVVLPLAVIVLMASSLGLVFRSWRPQALAFLGLVFLAFAVIGFAWGVDLIINGIPFANFSFSPGFFSLSIAYAAFLFSRFTLPHRYRDLPAAFCAPVLALVVAIPVDIGIMVVFVQKVSSMFSRA